MLLYIKNKCRMKKKNKTKTHVHRDPKAAAVAPSAESELLHSARSLSCTPLYLAPRLRW